MSAVEPGGVDKKRRNYVIAGAVGGFLLPLVGLIGALVFFANDDPVAGRIVALGAAAGVIAYVVVFAL